MEDLRARESKRCITMTMIRNAIAGKVKTGGKENADSPATVGKAGFAAATAGRKIAARTTGAIKPLRQS